MSTRVTDAELVEAFLGQADRCTHSGQMLGDCFSASQFDLAFQYGSVVQRSAIRHALIACLSLPAPDPCADPCYDALKGTWHPSQRSTFDCASHWPGYPACSA